MTTGDYFGFSASMPDCSEVCNHGGTNRGCLVIRFWAGLVADGHTPREIADKVGVTDNTVRSQIKSIFSKTGVKRQGELIRLLQGFAQPTVQSKHAI